MFSPQKKKSKHITTTQNIPTKKKTKKKVLQKLVGLLIILRRPIKATNKFLKNKIVLVLVFFGGRNSFVFSKKIGIFFLFFLHNLNNFCYFMDYFHQIFNIIKLERKKKKPPSNRLGFNYFQFKSSLTIHLILLHLDF